MNANSFGLHKYNNLVANSTYETLFLNYIIWTVMSGIELQKWTLEGWQFDGPFEVLALEYAWNKSAHYAVTDNIVLFTSTLLYNHANL